MVLKVRKALFALIAMFVFGLFVLGAVNGNALNVIPLAALLGALLFLIVHAATLPFLKRDQGAVQGTQAQAPNTNQKAVRNLAALVAIGLAIWVVNKNITSNRNTQQDTESVQANSDPSRVFLSRAEVGEDWPLTVASGTVYCSQYSVLFETNGRTYAVNGTAQTHTSYPAIDVIWKDSSDIEGAKMSIGPIIDPGLKLCD